MADKEVLIEIKYSEGGWGGECIYYTDNTFKDSHSAGKWKVTDNKQVYYKINSDIEWYKDNFSDQVINEMNRLAEKELLDV